MTIIRLCLAITLPIEMPRISIHLIRQTSPATVLSSRFWLARCAPTHSATGTVPVKGKDCLFADPLVRLRLTLPFNQRGACICWLILPRLVGVFVLVMVNVVGVDELLVTEFDAAAF